jgi:hypothetical protein
MTTDYSVGKQGSECPRHEVKIPQPLGPQLSIAEWVEKSLPKPGDPQPYLKAFLEVAADPMLVKFPARSNPPSIKTAAQIRFYANFATEGTALVYRYGVKKPLKIDLSQTDAEIDAQLQEYRK